MRFAPLVKKIDVGIFSSKNEQNRPVESQDIASNVRSKIYFLKALFARSSLEACKKKHVRRGHAGVWKVAWGTWEVAWGAWEVAWGIWEAAWGIWEVTLGLWKGTLGLWEVTWGLWEVTWGLWKATQGLWEVTLGL